MKAADEIVVIGAGMGGLAAAGLLAAKGYPVTVLEAAGDVGGKMRTFDVAGKRIDAGPTVLTMRPVFERLFAEIGTDLAGAVQLTRAEVLARHAWSTSEGLDLFADRDRSADAIGRFAGTTAARGYRAFCTHAESVYRTMDGLFMRADRPTPLGMVRAAGLGGLRGVLASAPFTTLWDRLGVYFPDERLRQLFGRYATYCGSSPFAAPATLALIAHVEAEGVWLVDGGMRALAAALRTAVTDAGATVRFNSEVCEILVERGRAAAVRLTSGEVIRCRAIVGNCDVGALAEGFFGMAARSAVAKDAMAPRSLSAATWGMAARVVGFPLAHHSVFFSKSSRQEFADLFEQGRPPCDPTVYICAQDRKNDGAMSNGAERLFIITNAPPDGGKTLSGDESRSRCRTAMMKTLERCGLRLEPEGEVFQGPSEFAALFPGTQGAIYGMASHGWAASFRRPGTRSRIRGLYMAGGSVHPGAGLPMAALSGRAAANNLMADLASM